MKTKYESETRTRTWKTHLLTALISLLILTLAFGGGYLLMRMEKEQEVQKREQQRLEAERHTALSADEAIKVAENINKHAAFGPGVEIHPQDIVHLPVGELMALNEGIGREGIVQYGRVILNGALPLNDAEITGNWDPPFFVINGRLLWIEREPNCAKSPRTVRFPSVWTMKNPDRMLVRVGGRSTFVGSDDSLADLLGVNVERVQELGIWPKTCKWTVELPTTQ